MLPDFKDYNTRYPGHPRYQSSQIIQDDVVNVIIQKLEMILFTRNGELFGNLDMGCDLEYYLWSTRVPSDVIKSVVVTQIDKYIPELNDLGYTFNIDIFEGSGNTQDIMELNFTVKGYNFQFVIN